MTTLPAFLDAAPAEAEPAFRLRPSPLAWLVGVSLAASAVALCVILPVTGMRLEIAGFARFGVLAAAMAVLAGWCARRRLDPRLGAAAAIVGTATLSLMLCGMVANAGLRLGFPLADARLAGIDGAFGLDSDTIIRSVAARPMLTGALSAFYNTSGPAVVALIVLTLARRRVAQAWELAATAFVSMQLVAIASPLAPAWGAMKHFGLERLQGHGLPAGAGVYQWPAFTHFYAGSDPVLRLNDMGGVVAFPSFHTVLALVVAQALAATRLRWLGVAWAAAIILSAIPMGGHYAVDLAAGFLVWLTAATLVRRVSTPSA